ncbi:MAG: hypothetical protein ACFCU3_06075 [Verrucomicrobiales bacterium]
MITSSASIFQLSSRRLSMTLGLCALSTLPVFFPQPLLAQSPDSLGPGSPPEQASPSAPNQPTPTQSNSSQPSSAGGQPTFLGRDIPFFDPGTETVTWDGRSWHITNNRLFQARFEKYLNAPEDTTESDRDYQQLLAQILRLLSPEAQGLSAQERVTQAFPLLARASEFEQDAKLGDALVNAVYNCWLAQRNQRQLDAANQALVSERERLTRNQMVRGDVADTGTTPPRDPVRAAEWAKDRQARRELESTSYAARMAEIQAILVTNRARQEVSEVQSRIEFQTLLVQLFFQRRFQHVQIGSRLYRDVFSDGDTKLRLGGEAEKFFAGSTGMPPTVGVLESLAGEALRDVREGVQAFLFLLENNELESATNRLGEAFVVGEFAPEIRTLPREDKRKALEFSQKAYQLLNALEVKDYTLAESVVRHLEVIAKDFDNSRAMAAIETARTVSAMHLAKAKNAAVSGDRPTLEEELRQATEIWPRNPALAEVSELIFSQADVQQQALIDLERLIAQRNFRQIYEDRIRFIAAAAMFPDRQEELAMVLEQMAKVEGAMIRAEEISKRGDYAGAWESVELAYRDFPDDNLLNELRANLTTQAATFVSSLRRAEDLESEEQYGSSLAWFLEAQRLYPVSTFAKEGIDRMVAQLMPMSLSADLTENAE